jgi:hypothetical protein
MRIRTTKYPVCIVLALLVLGQPLPSRSLKAQAVWPFGPPPTMAVPQTPDAQRNAMSTVRAQVGWLQNATQTASSYTGGGADMIWQQFQMLRNAYTGFTMTLNPQQTSYGANELAELSAGLDILQEAFTNYQDDLANGRSTMAAMNDLCQVLSQAAQVWLQEFNQDCSRIRAGW